MIFDKTARLAEIEHFFLGAVLMLEFWLGKDRERPSPIFTFEIPISLHFGRL